MLAVTGAAGAGRHDARCLSRAESLLLAEKLALPSCRADAAIRWTFQAL